PIPRTQPASVPGPAAAPGGLAPAGPRVPRGRAPRDRRRLGGGPADRAAHDRPGPDTRALPRRAPPERADRHADARVPLPAPVRGRGAPRPARRDGLRHQGRRSRRARAERGLVHGGAPAPRRRGVPEVPYLRTLAPAIYALFGIDETYEFMARTLGEDPAPLIEAGTSSDDWLRRVSDAFSLVCELPYYTAPGLEDTGPAGMS